jgi:hypothetical protein
MLQDSEQTSAGRDGTDRIVRIGNSILRVRALSHAAGRLNDSDDASMCCSDTTELRAVAPVQSKSFYFNF